MIKEVVEIPSAPAGSESEDCREVLARYLTETGYNVSELVLEETSLNDGNKEYVGFHVYEDYSDHTATVGWYDVHKSTHEIKDAIMGNVVRPGN
ncbi:MAG: hypothetical protein HFG41_07090 [Coprococcus sp.]|nr:hypothetical protein [Coprococcus sp.]